MQSMCSAVCKTKDNIKLNKLQDNFKNTGCIVKIKRIKTNACQNLFI